MAFNHKSRKMCNSSFQNLWKFVNLHIFFLIYKNSSSAQHYNNHLQHITDLDWHTMTVFTHNWYNCNCVMLLIKLSCTISSIYILIALSLLAGHPAGKNFCLSNDQRFNENQQLLHHFRMSKQFPRLKQHPKSQKCSPFLWSWFKRNAVCMLLRRRNRYVSFWHKIRARRPTVSMNCVV